ncbi:uncharacterized protein LOC9641909 [Selaginella moellendorffii]|uniref:uncharacterized protein LOC9641909 n=1 Tax=Selaginella moellendorffii TaxID=88036 RepID=UPI000D1CF766|nr:uncharacterized protein LOC9641909 [Selaginella moellendorffii]XP_024534351.1 uncharacterized protein LOC9641909 [Selaginella moellendorffii]|eukprot:XP_024534350.1 uncharacterized protein LOC9641909 [Selaginella moellendorffii]
MMLKSRSYSNHLVLTSHTQAVEVSVKAYFPSPHGTPDRHFPKPSPSSRNSTLHGDGRPSPSKTSSWKSVLYFWKRPRDHTPSSKEEHKHQVPRVRKSVSGPIYRNDDTASVSIRSYSNPVLACGGFPRTEEEDDGAANHPYTPLKRKPRASTKILYAT